MAGRSMLDETYLADPPEPEEAPPAEGETPEQETAPEQQEPAAAQVTRTPITRRQRAKERDESILRELQETRAAIAKQGETYSEQLARIERENAELRGHVQGLASRPSPEYQQRREEPSEDPRKILKEANALLDAKDFNGYQERYGDYLLARQAADPRFKPAPQQQQQQAPQLNPMLQATMSQYMDVVADQDALDLAQAADRRLARKGIQEGPQRWQLAFEEGRRYLKGQKKDAPTFSTKNREVLSGVPTARNGGTQGVKAGEPGVNLTAEESKMAKRFKMTDSQYAKHLAAMHPERISNE